MYIFASYSLAYMLQPSYLRHGDKVALVAPAKRIAPEETQYARQVLAEWGLEVVQGEHLYDRHHLFAGTPQARRQDLQTMLDRQDIRAIFCARGGYGTTKIVDKLDFSAFYQSPKWLVGFSDITVLHCELHRRGIESLHASMPLLFEKQQASLESLRKALFGEEYQTLSPAHPLNKEGEAVGRLIGGNFSLLANIISTPSDANTVGKILFIEDVDEQLYHLERMLVHLDRAGKLNALAGLLVGEFSDIEDADGFYDTHTTFYHLIEEIVAPYRYPVAYGFPTGHERQNEAIICGRQARLTVGKTGGILAYE